jgi:sugar fermentation stimulation protein A
MIFYKFKKPIILVRFTKRLNRFVAQFVSDNNEIIYAHTPNTGSMKGLLVPGAPCLLRNSQNPERKYLYSWIGVKIDNTWVGIDTLLTNKLVEILINNKKIEPLKNFTKILREQKIGEHSRIDLVIFNDNEKTYLEVKNVTLVENNIAKFPDAVTKRGKKHLVELMKKIDEGENSCMVYVIQRDDATSFQPAENIDPEYSQTLKMAYSKGVKIIAVSLSVSPEGLSFVKLLPFKI